MTIKSTLERRCCVYLVLNLFNDCSLVIWSGIEFHIFTSDMPIPLFLPMPLPIIIFSADADADYCII